MATPQDPKELLAQLENSERTTLPSKQVSFVADEPPSDGEYSDEEDEGAPSGPPPSAVPSVPLAATPRPPVPTPPPGVAEASIPKTS